MWQSALQATSNPQPLNWHIDENFKFTGTATLTNEVDLIYDDSGSRRELERTGSMCHRGDWDLTVVPAGRRFQQSLGEARQSLLTEE